MPLWSLKWGMWVAIALTLAASGIAPSDNSAVVAPYPHYRVGRPYQIDGTWYYPKEDWSYDKTGVASWYGKPFNGRRTANGEIFNLNALTAAHRTLPMPVVVRVTNLDNGRSVKLRVNDRGPFVATHNRIIDVSKHAASVLGFERHGIAPVRVQIDVPDSMRVAFAAGRYRLFGLHIPLPSISLSAISLPAFGLPTPALIALISALAGALGFWLLVLDDGRSHRAVLVARRAEPLTQSRSPQPSERVKLPG
jgi:hypothetical protein